MSEIEILYEGDLHCQTTHKSSGTTLQTDAPLDNQGRGEKFSPTDLVGTALGTCMVTIMGIAAHKRGVDIKGARVIVHKKMSKDLPRRIVCLEIDYFVPLPADHPHRKFLEAATLACPVMHSLHPKIEKKIKFHWS